MKKTILILTALAIFGCRKAENLPTTYDKLNGTYYARIGTSRNEYSKSTYVHNIYEFDGSQQAVFTHITFDTKTVIFDTTITNVRWQVKDGYFIVTKDGHKCYHSFEYEDKEHIKIDDLRYTNLGN